ncbi:hypothetical protein T484DRAFT_1788275, partial [Baffinella frigidus]
VTYAPVTVTDQETGSEVSGVDYYFIQQDGSKFKVLFKSSPYNMAALLDGSKFKVLFKSSPYFYVVAEEGYEREEVELESIRKMLV